MSDKRHCDACGAVGELKGDWYHVHFGHAQPSEFLGAAHWCVSCLKKAVQYLESQRQPQG